MSPRVATAILAVLLLHQGVSAGPGRVGSNGRLRAQAASATTVQQQTTPGGKSAPPFVSLDGGECGIYAVNGPNTKDAPPDQDIADSVHMRQDEFPWIGQLEDVFGTALCPAVILGAQWILSTASCMTAINLRAPFYAIYNRGNSPIYYRQNYQYTIAVDAVFKHPQFDPPSYDYALIHLYAPMEFPDDWTLMPACLPSPESCSGGYDCAANMSAYLTGWGNRGRVLQKSVVPLIATSDCQAQLQASLSNSRTIKANDTTQMCSGGTIDRCWFADGSVIGTMRPFNGWITDEEDWQFYRSGTNIDQRYVVCGLASDNSHVCFAQQPQGPKLSFRKRKRRPLRSHSVRRVRREAESVAESHPFYKTLGLVPKTSANIVAEVVGQIGSLNWNNYKAPAKVPAKAPARAPVTPRLPPTTQPSASASTTTAAPTGPPTIPTGIYSNICSALQWIGDVVSTLEEATLYD